MSSDESLKQTSHPAPTNVVPPPTADSEADQPRIFAYNVGAKRETLAPGRPHREWMDRTPARHAYRCLPLVIANQLGWDIINPVSFRARWLGGSAESEIQIEAESNSVDYVSGHFGNGILTFQIACLFRTPRNIGLMVGGPPNTPKDGLYPLSGFVETDWAYSTFTMNYQFTRSWHWVKFAAGESYCRLIPVCPQQIEELKASQQPIEQAPELAKQYREWSKGRQNFIRDLQNPWSPQASVGWQKDYFQGVAPDGEKQSGHRTHLQMCEFSGAVGPEVDHRRNKVSRDVTTTQSAFDVLWNDLTCFETRQQKHADVLIGIAHTLKRRGDKTDGERAFLESFDRLATVDPDTLNTVLSQPQIYSWTRLAFALLDFSRNNAPLSPFARRYCDATGDADAERVLERHWRQFAVFELSAALLSNVDCHLPKPLSITLPLAVAGTPFIIGGDGETTIEGVVDGSLIFSKTPTTPHAIIQQAPLVEYNGWQLRIQPHAATGLGLDEVKPCLQAGHEFQQRHAELVFAAMEKIDRYATDSFRQMSATIDIVGLKPLDLGTYTNVSFSELPGLMLLSVVQNAHVMADRMIHEFHHNRLFHIEDAQAILDPAGPIESEFYSPWRNDPRPLRGVLHGLYVFMAVARYWQNVWAAAKDPDVNREYVADQARRILLQCRKAESTLLQHAVFTPFGEGLFSQIQTDLTTLEQAAEASRIAINPPAIEVTADGRFVPQRSITDGSVLHVVAAVEQHEEAFRTWEAKRG